MLSELEIREIESLIKKCIKTESSRMKFKITSLRLCCNQRIKKITYIFPSRFAGSAFIISFLMIVDLVFHQNFHLQF